MPLPILPQAELTVLRRFPPRMYLNDGELDLIVGLIASVNPKTVIEFGVNVGLTAQVLLNYVPGIKHYQGIDLAAGGRTTLLGQQPEVPINPGWLVKDDGRFELILRPRGAFDLRATDLRPCEAVFIDGDHSYEGVMCDSTLAYSVMQQGGIIVWHDYGNHSVEVTQALEDLAMHDGHTIKQVENTWLAFERF